MRRDEKKETKSIQNNYCDENERHFAFMVEKTKSYILQQDMHWMQQIAAILREFNDYHALTERNKKVSSRTMTSRANVIYHFFKIIRAEPLNYKIKSIYNISENHITAYFKKREKDGIASSTLALEHTVINTFSKWIGKAGMVKKLENYLDNPENSKRHYVAETDKGWSSKNVDIHAIIEEISKTDEICAMQLRFQLEFGLRKREAVCVRPHRIETIDGQYIQIYQGTKGGKYRTIPITRESQRKLLTEAKLLVKSVNGFLGDSNKSLEQNLRRLQYVCESHGITKKELGVTQHGLRHEFTRNFYQELTGDNTPAMGGDVDKFFSKENSINRYRVSVALGHERLSITGAYLGGIKNKRKSKPNETE